MTSVRLFLVRHGRTELNAAGLLRGEIDVPLDPVGKKEAAQLGKAFGEISLDVVSSPLARAVATAQALVADPRSVRLDDPLRDRTYGSWAGHAPAELVEAFGSVDRTPRVEPRGEVEARARDALVDALHVDESCEAVNVALVTHDAILRILLGMLLPDLDADKVALPTGSWSELHRTDEPIRWCAVSLGTTP